MRLAKRKYRGGADDQVIREFLRAVFLLNQRREYCWPVYRWDYWLWHVNKNLHHFNLQAAIFLWEDSNSKLAAVLNPDNPGEAFLQVHPDYRSPELEVEMMLMAETQYSVRQPDGSQKLVIWSPECDSLRKDILQRRGYTRQDWAEYQRCRDLTVPIAEASLPEGFAVRSLAGENELPARSWLSWKAFHPEEPDEKYQGWEWYLNVQKAPLYRQDLDLVAVAPDGELAAFCTVWFDSLTQTAAFEPVGTHPAYQRRGLGRAVMSEGLSRARELGATLAAVGSYSEAAGQLYASMGFTEYTLSEPWVKLWS